MLNAKRARRAPWFHTLRCVALEPCGLFFLCHQLNGVQVERDNGPHPTNAG